MSWVHSETWDFGPGPHTATISAAENQELPYYASVVFYGPEVERKTYHHAFETLREAQEWCERWLANPPLPTTRRETVFACRNTDIQEGE